MGGLDKGLVLLGGRPMIECVLDRIAPQVGAVVISANRHLEQYRRYGFPVVTDADGSSPGPLGGVLAGIAVATTPYVLTAPCDTPNLPQDLLFRLWRALCTPGAEIAVAHDGLRTQRAFMLMHRNMQRRIEEYLATPNRSIERWFAPLSVMEADFSDRRESFANVNTGEDLAAAQSGPARES
jgi:molybdenum cofactor guanylyltransferase